MSTTAKSPTLPTVTVFVHNGHRHYAQPTGSTGRFTSSRTFAVADLLGDDRYRVRPVGEDRGPVVRGIDAADLVAARWAAEGIR